MPPPCARTGATGTTRWNNIHNSSGAIRSTSAALITPDCRKNTPTEMASKDLVLAQPTTVVEHLDEVDDLGSGSDSVKSDVGSDFLFEQGPETLGIARSKFPSSRSFAGDATRSLGNGFDCSCIRCHGPNVLCGQAGDGHGPQPSSASGGS